MERAQRGNMQIKIYRGTHRIGGCITEIKTANARIFIDIGAELPVADKAETPSPKIEGLTQGRPDCDGVFITHYHGDHVGMFEEVLPSIPIYMGSTAKQIYTVVRQTLKRKLDKGNPELVENFKTFSAGEPIYIKDLKLTPYFVDHSAFDAYMFLIEAENKRILHTGDFRMHGAKGNKMPAVFKKYARNIDALIIEGTMLSRRNETIITERELGVKARQILQSNKNVFVICSSTNIDTIAEFYGATMAVKRPFIVCDDDFQLEILRIVTANSKSSFYNFNRQKIYVYGENLHSFMNDRGFCFVGRANRICQKALEAFPDNVLVYSMWKGYLDKSSPAYDEYKRAFIEKAVKNGSRPKYLHTSGHASAQQLKQTCEITGAKLIIPIHSENPEAFLQSEMKDKVRILHDGESISI